MIKVVFIDIDNTLLSFSGYVKETMRIGFEFYGLKPYTDDMFETFEEINNGLWRQLEKGQLTFAELEKVRWNLIFKELGIDFDGPTFEKYFRNQLYNSAIPEPGAIEFLDYLKGKYILCAASNGPYEQQLHRLEIGGMYNYFSDFFISSKIGASKPGSEFFDYCFDELKKQLDTIILPEETIIIGDSMTSDIAGGRGYGMHTCLYNRDNKSEADLRLVDYVINDLRDIKSYL